jgi:uncharacterized membrane protein
MLLLFTTERYKIANITSKKKTAPEGAAHQQNLFEHTHHSLITLFSLDGPITASYLIEADVSGGTAAAAMLCAVAAMPNIDFFFGLALCLLVRAFRINSLSAKRTGNLTFTFHKFSK